MKLNKRTDLTRREPDRTLFVLGSTDEGGTFRWHRVVAHLDDGIILIHLTKCGRRHSGETVETTTGHVPCDACGP